MYEKDNYKYNWIWSKSKASTHIREASSLLRITVINNVRATGAGEVCILAHNESRLHAAHTQIC